MKNLTRVLALVLVFALMLSTVAFAGTFTDVDADDDYAEAIETLAALGILKGYEDGSFGADKAITRAEAVAIVNRIQDLATASAGAQSVSLYTDVAADHWALGDINLATQMGTVSGDGNGKFRPEDQVSYQEMVKMLVVALGYTQAANDKGGWPTGYLVVAAQAGMLEDTDNLGAAPAPRGVVAQLVFNALTKSPMMKQTGFGDNKSWEVMDKDGETEILLTEKLDIYKVAVTPIANDYEKIEGTSLAKVGYVKVKITDDDAWFGVEAAFSNEKIDLVKGDSDIDAKLGYEAIAYIQKNADKEWEVLYSTINDGETIVVEIDPATILDVDEDKQIIEVEDEDLGLEEEYDFDDETIVIIDGAAGVAFSTKLMDAFYYANTDDVIEGTITVLFNKNDDAAKYIFVKSYVTDMIDEVNTTASKIYLEQGATIDLNEKNNKNLVYSITMDGKDVELKDLQENDIITYRTANDGDYYEIIVTRTTIEGSIEAIGVDDGETIYTIGDEDYKASVSGAAAGLNNKLPSAPGNAGTFYFDAFGKIAFYEKGGKVATDRDYAYVIDSAADTSAAFGATLSVKLMTAEGVIDIFDVADKFTVNYVTVDGDELAEEVANAGEAYDVYDGSDINQDVIDLLNDLEGTIIEYTVNTAGTLTEITFAYNNAGAYENEDGYLTFDGSDDEAEFDELNAELGDWYITDEVVVFYVGDADTDEDEYKVLDKAAFEDKEFYDIDAYVVNADKEIGIIVLKTAVSTGNEKTNIGLYTGYSTQKNDEGRTVSAISFLEKGELVTLLCESNSASAFEVAKGSVITYELNDKGEVTDVTANATVADVLEMWEDGVETNYARPADDQVHYVIGQVYGRDGNSIKLGDFTSKAFETHKVSSDAIVYLVDNSGTKVKIGVSELAEIRANKFDRDTDEILSTDDADNYVVVIKYYDKKATDVVIYKNFLND